MCLINSALFAQIKCRYMKIDPHYDWPTPAAKTDPAVSYNLDPPNLF